MQMHELALTWWQDDRGVAIGVLPGFGPAQLQRFKTSLPPVWVLPQKLLAFTLLRPATM